MMNVEIQKENENVLILSIPVQLEVTTGSLTRPKYYHYDGKTIGSGRKPLPKSYIRPEFQNEYAKGSFTANFLKSGLVLIPIKATRNGKKVQLYRLYDGDNPILANPRKAGTASNLKISGQMIWQQQHPAMRAKAANALHAMYEAGLPDDLALPPFPIKITGEFHTQPNLWNWDIGNLSFPYGKTFTDSLKKAGYVPDDNISFVSQEPTGLLFRPIAEGKQSFIQFRIEHDSVLANHPLYPKTEPKMDIRYPFKQTFPDMYVKDNKGEVRVFQVSVLADTYNYARIITNTGQFNGKSTAKVTAVQKGKNLGKVNETLPVEQALADAQSRILKKEREGYKTLEQWGITKEVEDANLIESFQPGKLLQISDEYVHEGKTYNSLYAVLKAALPKHKVSLDGDLLPMKAQSYWKDPKTRRRPRPTFPAFAQPKINGVRCFATLQDGVLVLLSKKGLTYTLPHIEIDHKVFNEIAVELGVEAKDVVLDGELYVPGMKLQDIISNVRVMQLETQLVQFYCFDIAVKDILQDKRTATLKWVFANTNGINNVVYVPTFKVANHAQVRTLFQRFIAEGYEGLITRSIDGVYAFGHRVKYMTKLKKKESAEFRIINIVDTDKNPGVALFVCRNDVNDLTFKVNPEGSEIQKRYWFDNKHLFIGKEATVEFYERTNDQLPLHATLVAVRDYE